MPEENTPINIQTEDSKVFLRHQELIEQHERTAAALRRDLERQIELRYGIDMRKEDWVLDLNRGILERIGEVRDVEESNAPRG